MILAWLIGTPMTENMVTNLSCSQKDSGGWVYTQLNCFVNEDTIEKVVIVSVSDSYECDENFSIGKMCVHSIKDNPIRWNINKQTFKKIDRILSEEKVDILDIQGTETTLSSYPVYSNVSIPMVNTLHGIAYQCHKFYTLGLPTGFMLWGRSVYDIISLHGIFEAKFLMKRRAMIENQTLRHIKNVRGRTEWDRCSALFVNPELNYFHTELIMRSAFYESNWKLDTCKKDRIFVPQMRIPYKGCFILLEALKYVKNNVPNIEIHIPGNPMRTGFKQNGYEKYIWHLIEKYGLSDNIRFLGNLNAEQMASELVEARVFVLPSIIENSPNSLTEAQIVGTPSVASLVGGVLDYINNEDTGILYNSMDPVMCAESILKVMKDDSLSVQLSANAKKSAYRRHDPIIVTKSIIECYTQILKENKK